VKKITIAIDGHSSCGKSTLAKALSKALNYIYIDSGAMYRAVTYFFLENNINLEDNQAIAKALSEIEIRFKRDERGIRTILNGIDVENEIREMRVSEMVSPVATISAVRKELVKQQRQLGKEKGIVMDGRDIGTVVFKDAELKIFLTADPEIRVQRRYDELKAKGLNVDLETVKANLLKRDHIDSTREDSPLRKAADAIVINNTLLTPPQQLEKALELVNEKIKETAN
jgi:cytidylate kinase